MKQVTAREALRDLSKYLRDMYTWCDQNGSCTTDAVSVSRGKIRQLRRLVDAVLEADMRGENVKLCDRYDSVYAQLCDKHHG